MALYQPSNITPSTFAGIGGSVIDATDNVSISWQVNGTSAMTGFSISIYKNDIDSTFVHTFTETLSTPFYGTDGNGNPRFYVYEPSTTWAEAGLVNDYEYKMKITQNWTSPGGTQSVIQASDSVFTALNKPTLYITPASGTLTSVTQTFRAVYAQAQGDSVTWVRWVLSDSGGNVIDDTGTIYTGELVYSYNGFFSGQTYTLSCTVESSSGVTVTAENTYTVSYSSAAQSGGLSLACNPDNSVTVSWAAGTDIPGTPSASPYGSISDGVLHLNASRSILWNTVNGEAMSFPSPYCFAWRGVIAGTSTQQTTVNSGAWTSSGSSTQTLAENRTLTASSWTRNPDASSTATRQITVNVPVTTAQTSTATYRSNRVTINTIMTDGEYKYKNGIPAILTLPDKIVSYGPSWTAFLVGEGADSTLQPPTSLHVDEVDDHTLYLTVSTDQEVYLQEIYVQIQVTTMTSAEYSGSATQTPYSGDTGISNPAIYNQPSDLTSATVTWDGTRFTVAATSRTSGTYPVTVQYTHTVSQSNLYMAVVSGTLNAAGGTLQSGTVTSTSPAGKTATVTVNRTSSGATMQNAFYVTVYNSTNTGTVSVAVRLTYTKPGTANYTSTVSVSKPGTTAATVLSTTADNATVTGQNGTYTVTMTVNNASSTPAVKQAVLQFSSSTYPDSPVLAKITHGTSSAVFKILNGEAALLIDNSAAASLEIPSGAWSALLAVYPGRFEAHYFDASGLRFAYRYHSINQTLPSPIDSVTAYGKQDCDYIFLTSNTAFDFVAHDFSGAWDADTLFYAPFITDLQAGTVTSEEALSVAIYRRSGTSLSPVGTFGTSIQSIRDYAVRSMKEYSYEMFYVSEGVYSAGAESEPICMRFRQHTLIEAEPDAEQPDVYHPVNVWRFRDNLDAGAYTNQNSPVLLENFTAYPLWQPHSPRAKSGTLTALLGRFVNGVYSGETAEDMERLFALSASVNPLFYRDMKGNLYMVRLSGPITQTVNNATGVMEVSVSVPWVEVGSADDVKIYTEG